MFASDQPEKDGGSRQSANQHVVQIAIKVGRVIRRRRIKDIPPGQEID